MTINETQPNGNSMHYVFEHVDGHEADMRLRNANGKDEFSYYIHITQDGEPTDQHVVLHTGLTASSKTPVAAAVYTSSTAGQITSPTSPTGPLTWDSPRNAMYSAFTVSGRNLRWTKSYPRSIHTPVFGRKPKGITWTLTDATFVPNGAASSLTEVVGATLATLELAPLQGKRSHAEVGNLVLLAALEGNVQETAIMVGMALWHRDRQIQAGRGLGPKSEVDVLGRTTGLKANRGLASLAAGEVSGMTVAW